MHPYSSIDVTAAWKKLRFILSVRSDFHIVDSLLIAVHAFVNLVSMSFSVDSTLLPRYVNLSTSLRGVPSRVEMSPVWFSSYVRIQVVVLKTCLGRWTIGRSGERGSGISVLPARYDDDDDDIVLKLPYDPWAMLDFHWSRLTPTHCLFFIGHSLSYLPSPPLGQDMTQGQFLSGV